MLRISYWASLFLLLVVQSLFAQTPVWVPVNPPPNRTINFIEAIHTSLFALTDTGVFVTKDDGTNWEKVTGFYGDQIHEIFKCDSILFVVTRRNQAPSDLMNILNRSTNDGVSWDSTHVVPDYFTGTNTGMFYYKDSTGLYYESLDKKAHVWIDSENSKVKTESLLKASENNFIVCAIDSQAGAEFKVVGWKISADLGKTWRNFAPPTNIDAYFAIDGNMVLASVAGAVFRSVDTCRTWQVINPANGGRFAKKSNIMYLRNTGRVGYSLDHGFTWRQMSDGLPRLNIFGFTINDEKLYAKLEHDGVYRTSVPSAVKSNQPTGTNCIIYPNPLTSEGNITYSLPTHSTVSLTIYDALGRAVATPISDQPQDAGEHTMSFDAKNMNPGVYACHFSMGAYESVVKCIVVR